MPARTGDPSWLSGPAAVRVAIVGAGISGLSAAHLLSQRHEVELFEKDARLGGHAHTHVLSHGGREWTMDSGFLVYNHRNYPNFAKLLAELGVEGQPSDMCFSVRCRPCGLEYSSRGLNGLFAQRRRALDPRHLRMLAEIPRFNRRALALLDAPEREDPTLGAFLRRGRLLGGLLAALPAAPRGRGVVLLGRGHVRLLGALDPPVPARTTAGSRSTRRSGGRSVAAATATFRPSRAAWEPGCTPASAPSRSVASPAGSSSRPGTGWSGASTGWSSRPTPTRPSLSWPTRARREAPPRRLPLLAQPRGAAHRPRRRCRSTERAWASWNWTSLDCRDASRPHR